MRRTLEFGSKTIEYDLSFAERKTLGIKVNPDMEVFVKAPLGSPIDRIELILRRRAPWILKQQDDFLAHFPKMPPKKFISGETHLYLGRQYRLKIEAGSKESVKLNGRFLVVITNEPGRVSQLLDRWYKTHAKAKFGEYCSEWVEKFKIFGVVPDEIKIRKMQKRWGSCSTNGKIILNQELIKTPKGCIEYVIIHELCHLIHYNHDSNFYDLQTRMMPTWEKWKARLEKFLA